MMIDDDYTLVNYSKPPFLKGKSTNLLWPFSIAMLNYQRVTSQNSDLNMNKVILING